MEAIHCKVIARSERKDGRWEGRYTAGHDPATGKQVFKNVLGKTQAEVKEKPKKALVECRKIDFTKTGQYTVGTWMGTWFGNVAKIKVRRQIARVDGQIVEAPLKTKNSYRAVSISPQAIEVLREQKRKTNDTYVFPVAVPGINFAWRSRLVSCRPLPLVRHAPPATGGARLTPPLPTVAPSPRIA